MKILTTAAALCMIATASYAAEAPSMLQNCQHMMKKNGHMMSTMSKDMQKKCKDLIKKNGGVAAANEANKHADADMAMSANTVPTDDSVDHSAHHAR